MEMTPQDAMAADWRGAAAGFLLLAAYLFGPGYLLGYWTGWFGFRSASLVVRSALALCLSIAIVPLAANCGGRFNLSATAWIIALFGLAGLALAAWDSRRGPRGPLRLLTIGTAAWTLLAIASVSDLALGNRLYFSTLAMDHGLRIGMVNALAHQSQLPPTDPFLRPDLGIPLGYHYFWFLLASLAKRVAGDWLSARGALHGSIVWAGLALAALLFLWLRRLGGALFTEPRALAVAALLSALSGLDLLAYGLALLRQGSGLPAPTLGWWNGADEITAWTDLILWTPHCIASLVAGGTGLLLVLGHPEQPRPKLALFVAGAAFASSAGLAIYVCFGLATALAAWAVLLLARRQWPPLQALCLAGAAAALLAAPFAWDLSRAASGAPFALLGLRRGMIPQLLFGPNFPVLAGLPFELPIGLLVEAGFFAWAWRAWRRRDPAHPDRALLQVLLAASLGVTLFLRSDSVGTNDLGMRAVLPAQFALAVAAGLFLLGRPAWRPWPAALLAVGLLGTAAELVLLRTATLLPERGIAVRQWPFPTGAPIGELTRDMRAAYAYTAAAAERSAVVQHNPGVDDDSFSGLYNRQRVRIAGRYQLRYRPRYKDLVQRELSIWEPVFTGAAPPPEIPAQPLFLLVRSTDPALRRPGAWTDRAPVLFTSPTVTIFGTLPQQAARTKP